MLTKPLVGPLLGAINRALNSAPGNGGGGSSSFPVEPLWAIYSEDNTLSDGRVVPNRYGTTPFNNNLFNLSTGYIRTGGGAGVVTNFFALGPGGAMTASRVELATDATVMLVQAGGAPPAGNYTIKVMAKLNSGGPTKDIRFGDATPGYTTTTVNDTTWTPLIITNYAASGTTYDSISILPGIGASPVDLLIDEIQWYLAAETMPSFSTEQNDYHLKVRNRGFPGSLSRTGNLLNNSSGGSVGNVLNPAFPAAVTYTELTAIVAFKFLTLGTGQMLVTEADAVLGTTTSSLQLGVNAGTGIQGQLTMAPINSGTTRVDTVGQGWHTYAIRMRNLNRECYFNGIELNSATTAFAGIQARLLNLGGATAASPARGDFGVWAFWNSYLSDADFAASHRKIEADIAAMGESMGTFDNFYIAEGDSITANAFVTADGPSYAYLLGAAGEFAGEPPLYLRNKAVSSSGIATLETRKANTLLVISQAIAAGARPIVTVLIGTNDTTEIAAGYLAYYAKLKSYWADLRAAGAKVVACTLLPANVGNPTWDAQRALLNAYMRTQTADYDALADLAADPDIGPDAAPAALVYYYDTIHLNGAGHLKAKPIVKAAIQTVMA